MTPAAVDVWSRDSILYTDHPARVIGPWPVDPKKTLLQMGESGPGLIVAAATIAGRFVVTLPEPGAPSAIPPMDEWSESTAALYAQLTKDAAVHPGSVMVPVGILYAGPPCAWAAEQILKVFGEGARAISHANATEQQLRDVREVRPETPCAVVYIGVIGPEGYPDDIEMGIDQINSPLFIGAIAPEPEQIEEAVRNIGSGELVILTPPPFPGE